MSIPARLRVFAVVLTAAAALAALAKSLLSPLPIEPAPKPVVFPSTAPVIGWETLQSAPDPTLPHTTQYRQTRGNLTIELELQFIPDIPTHYVRNPLIDLRFLPRGHLPLNAGLQFYVSSRGQVVTNRQTDTPLDTLVDTHEPSLHSGYGIWAADQRLHLSTIITPAGEASMETRRVFRNLYLNHVTATSIAEWLLGRANLPDRRCVLVHFSIPAPAPAGAEEGSRILQDAWSQWRDAFQPVFPK